MYINISHDIPMNISIDLIINPWEKTVFSVQSQNWNRSLTSMTRKSCLG